MTEYVEKDIVINDIGELFTICYETLPNEYGHHFIVEKELQTHLDFVRNLPAADVVEVVRCKNCRSCMEFTPQYKKASGYYGTCRKLLIHMLDEMDAYVKEVDYCSYGKRKEGQQ